MSDTHASERAAGPNGERAIYTDEVLPSCLIDACSTNREGECTSPAIWPTCADRLDSCSVTPLTDEIRDVLDELVIHYAEALKRVESGINKFIGLVRLMKSDPSSASTASLDTSTTTDEVQEALDALVGRACSHGCNDPHEGCHLTCSAGEAVRTITTATQQLARPRYVVVPRQRVLETILRGDTSPECPHGYFIGTPECEELECTHEWMVRCAKRADEARRAAR